MKYLLITSISILCLTQIACTSQASKNNSTASIQQSTHHKTKRFTDETVVFEQLSYEKAFQKAKEANKLLLIDFYTEWCGPCAFLDENIFPLKKVHTYFNSHFINLKVDVEKGEGIDLAKKFHIHSYPTLLWINHNGEVVHQLIGSQYEDTLLEIARSANHPKKNGLFLQKKYQSGIRNTDFLQDYIVQAIYADSDYAEALEIYYQKKPLKKMFNALDWKILTTTTQSVSDKKFKFITKNKKRFSKVVGKLSVKEFIEKRMKKQIKFVKKHNKNDAHALNQLFKELTDMDEYYGKKFSEKESLNKLYHIDRLKWIDALVDFHLKHDYDDPKKLNEIANTFTKNFQKTPETLNKLSQMAERAVELDNNHMNYDTYAMVLHKMNHIEKARQYAQKSLELANKYQKKHLWSFKFLNQESH